MAREDLLIFSPTDGTGPTLVTSDDLSDPVILGCSGIYALSSYVLRTLLTTRGSWPANPEEGTDLVDAPGSNFDQSSLRALVARSVIEVERTIKKKQIAKNYPLDEVLSSLEVESISFVTPAHVVIRVLVKSASGDYIRVTTEV